MSQKDQNLEIYKLAVEMSDKLSVRRGASNVFFISIQTAFSASFVFWLNSETGLSLKKAIALTLISLVLSTIWCIHIQTYRNLSKAKFEVIHEIENHLTYAPFTREWEIVSGFKRKHFDLTRTEGLIPVVFFLLNLMMAVSALNT